MTLLRPIAQGQFSFRLGGSERVAATWTQGLAGPQPRP